ncbi:hypothetical protein FRC09_005968 [Ceratobasidium sp. 395]|nr:hypothetical protein FRC09_005968 [Ceratobasidium sp. 395]
MGYSKTAVAYTRFRQTGQVLAASSIPLATLATPAEWLDLPFGADIPRSSLFGAELETIMINAAMLPQEHRERAENLVRLTNDLQSHLPASNGVGAWGSPVPPPKLIPSTPFRTPPVPLFVPIWAILYFKPPSSFEETVFHVWAWLEALVKSGALIHKSSGTLLGGDTGVVWVIRVLLVLFFNYVGVKYRVGFPDPIPADCDISLLRLGEWPRLLSYMDSWTQRLRDSVAILQRTSDSRALGLQSFVSLELLNPTTELQTITDPPSSPTPPQLSKKKSKGKGKQKLTDYASGSEEDASSSEGSSLEDEEDFEQKDKQAEDADDDEEEDEGMDMDADMGRGHATSRDDLEHSSPVSDGTIFLSAQESTGLLPNQVNSQSRSNKPTRPIVPWKKRANAFGAFIVLQHQPASAIKSGAIALDLLSKAERNWTAASTELNLLCDLYEKPLELDPGELTAASSTAAPILAEYLLRRRAAWKRAESLAQSIFEVAARILDSMRMSMICLAKVNQQIEFYREAGAGFEVPATALETRVEYSSKAMTTARWTYVELEAFEGLTTRRSNQLQGNWLANTIPSDLAGLHNLAQGQVLWANAFSTLKTSHIDKRKQIWSNVTSVSSFPREHLTSGMRFAFGNPTGREEPTGLLDALARAAEELVNPSSTQPLPGPNAAAITNTLDTTKEDVPMADAPSDTPVIQQSPALEPTDTNGQAVAQDLPTLLANPTPAAVPAASAEHTSSRVTPASPIASAASVTPIAPTNPNNLPTPASSAVPAVSNTPAAPATVDSPTAHVASAPAATNTTTSVAAEASTLAPAPGSAIDTAPSISSTVRSPPPPASPSAGEPTGQKPTGKKSASHKSNGPEGSVRRTSARFATTRDDETEAPKARTRTQSKLATGTKATKGTAAAVKPVPRKSKTRR